MTKLERIRKRILGDDELYEVLVEIYQMMNDFLSCDYQCEECDFYTDGECYYTGHNGFDGFACMKEDPKNLVLEYLSRQES